MIVFHTFCGFGRTTDPQPFSEDAYQQNIEEQPAVKSVRELTAISTGFTGGTANKPQGRRPR